MATTPSNPSKKENRGFPPRRGQIKAQIFESWVKTISSVASKAGEILGRIWKEGGGGGGGSGGDSSASGSPPPTAYNSDANSDRP